MKSYIHKDKAGKWRITLIARNGRIVMDGGQGYSSKGHAVAASKRLSLSLVSRAFALPVVTEAWPLPKRAAAKKVAG